jgi:cytochrome P450
LIEYNSGCEWIFRYLKLFFVLYIVLQGNYLNKLIFEIGGFSVKSIDLFAPDFKDQAYQLYQKLREEDPVHQITMPNGLTGWIISRYEDGARLLKDSRLLSNPHSLFTPQQVQSFFPLQKKSFFYKHLLNVDPPDHTRLRSLVQKSFTPSAVEQLRSRIQRIADELLEPLLEQKQFDLIESYAFPLPIFVISEMLGIPKEDRNKFREWSNAFVSAVNHPERNNQILHKMEEFYRYLQNLLEERRNNLQDDLISALIQAGTEENRLTEVEIYSMVFLLIIAGHETTVHLIGNGVYSLLQHPEQYERLRAEPNLIHSAIEEFLRYMGPVEVTTNRWAAEPIQLHGKTIAKKDVVLISLASINRDPAKFDDPEKLYITREKNDHLAFGSGIHYCLGAALARLEGSIAIQTLLERIPHFELAVDPKQLKWIPSMLIRGFQSLPIRIL